jgi:hypothetical protein
MGSVDRLGRKGELSMEDPLEVASPLLHFLELGVETDRLVRSGPLNMLTCNGRKSYTTGSYGSQGWTNSCD